LAIKTKSPQANQKNANIRSKPRRGLMIASLILSTSVTTDSMAV
jgi:hypothetical protein